MATYTTLAIVDDVNTCDCCGKSNLKSTVAMQRDDGEILYFGSVCATRHSGRVAKVIKSEAAAVLATKCYQARQEFYASAERKALEAIQEAARRAGLLGLVFKNFCIAELAAADEKRASIAAKFGLSHYAF